MRSPDVVIGGKERPYLKRWYLIPQNPWCNIYLHLILRSDDDRALHDHPWWNVSIVLSGGYVEVLPGERWKWRPSGSIVFRRATASHRLVLLDCRCWSLFLTGPRVRAWGFWCPKGWRHWREFTNPLDSGAIGKGCD